MMFIIVLLPVDSLQTSYIFAELLKSVVHLVLQFQFYLIQVDYFLLLLVWPLRVFEIASYKLSLKFQNDF